MLVDEGTDVLRAETTPLGCGRRMSSVNFDLQLEARSEHNQF